MDFEHFLREANTKPDYNTNAGSYYKDLARKQQLIELLAKKIWEYEELIDDTLENLSLRLETYINENDSLMSDRLKNWDERIENLDEEVSHIFVEWLNDGTLEQIINHDVLGNKADQTELDKTNAQLEQKASGKFYRSSGSETQPNVVSGSIYNKVEDGYTGNVITGGGTDETHANVIGGNVDAIGNPELSNYATSEILATNTNSNLSTILGGYDNVLQGIANNISGHHNGMKTPTNHSSIAGGVFNLISWGMGQSIAGGQQNKIQSTSKTSQGIVDSSNINGGVENTVDDSGQSVISGGLKNTIKTGAINTISGGGSNTISGDNTTKNSNTIGGGSGNTISNGTGNTVAGGTKNTMSSGSYSTIVGGTYNESTSDYTTVLGSKAKAYASNQVATGFNTSFAEVGDAQVSENLKVKTTTDGTSTYVNTFLRPNSMAAVKITVTARRTDVVGDYAVFLIKGAVNVSAGSNGTLIGTPIIDKFNTTGAANWLVTLSMVAAQVTVGMTGEAGKNIQWSVHYEFSENLG